MDIYFLEKKPPSPSQPSTPARTPPKRTATLLTPHRPSKCETARKKKKMNKKLSDRFQKKKKKKMMEKNEDFHRIYVPNTLQITLLTCSGYEPPTPRTAPAAPKSPGYSGKDRMPRDPRVFICAPLCPGPQTTQSRLDWDPNIDGPLGPRSTEGFITPWLLAMTTTYVPTAESRWQPTRRP